MPPRTRTQRAKENKTSTFVLSESPIVLVPRISSLRPQPSQSRLRASKKTSVVFPTISSLPPSSPVPTSSYPEDVAATPSKQDPFGFFAVEKRLKAQKDSSKIRRVLQPKVFRDPNKPIPVLNTPSKVPASIKATPRNNDRDDFIPSTPTHTRTFLDYSLIPSVPTPMGSESRAATPRQRCRKTHLPTTPGPSSPFPYSFPQTPSPNKRNHTLPETDHTELSYEPSVSAEEENHQPIDEGKGKEKAAMNSKEGSSTVGDSTLAEQELASATEELKALLPSRPIHKSVSKKRVKQSKSDTTKAKGRKRSTAAQKQAREKPQKARKPRSTTKKREESVARDEEDQEKYEKERASRLEYFRKLDEDYQLPEEKVYII